MKKAVSFLLTGILLTGMCITGCSGTGGTNSDNTVQSEQEGQDKEPVTIRFAWWGSRCV